MKSKWWKIGAGVIALAGLILFICNIQWVDAHNGSLMVLITAVYVIATVMIMIANRRTVDAANAQVEESRKQLEESHKQFLESKRLEYMPFLQMEQLKTSPSTADLVIRLNAKDGNSPGTSYFTLKNIGNGSAVCMIYNISGDAFDGDGGSLDRNALMNSDQIIVRIDCGLGRPRPNDITITWQYDDILENSYEQRIIIHHEHNHVTSCETDYPKCLGVPKYKLKEK